MAGGLREGNREERLIDGMLGNRQIRQESKTVCRKGLWKVHAWDGKG